MPIGSTPVAAPIIQQQQYATQPITQPIIQPVVQPTTQLAATQPLTQPIGQPVTQPPTQAAVTQKKKKGWGIMKTIKKAFDLDNPPKKPPQQQMIPPMLPQAVPTTTVENQAINGGNLEPLKRRKFEDNQQGGLSVTAPNLQSSLGTTQVTKPVENTLSSTILERKRPPLDEPKPQYVETLNTVDKENMGTIPNETVASQPKEFELRKDYYKDANSSINRAKELAERYSNRYEPVNTRALSMRGAPGENDLNTQDLIKSSRPEIKSNILVEDISSNEKRGSVDVNTNLNRGYHGYKNPLTKSMGTNNYGRGKVEERPRFR